jgi:aminopeptidase
MMMFNIGCAEYTNFVEFRTRWRDYRCAYPKSTSAVIPSLTVSTKERLMNRPLVPLLFSLAFTFVLVACEPAPATTPTPSPAASSAENSKSAPPVDWEILAERLVNQSAGVKENDIVQVSGGAQDMDLLESIAVQVRKRGAFPFVRVFSDRIDRRTLSDAPDKYDAQQPQADLKLASITNVVIDVDHRLNEDLYGSIDPKRVIERNRASNAIYDELVKRNVRQVYLSNNLYPTPWMAKRFGLTENEMKKVFWDGVNSDYTSVQATGESVKKTLSSGSELHVTNPNGTDLKVSIKGRPWFVSDGLISPEDEKKGGQSGVVWLPAGKCFPQGWRALPKGKQSLRWISSKEKRFKTLL